LRRQQANLLEKHRRAATPHLPGTEISHAHDHRTPSDPTPRRPPLMVCDPAFVAELPDFRGMLHKIGHFDEIGGVTHIEI
jgi:hypothetical protein